MRAILAIVLLLIVLGFVGWLQFSTTDGDPTIRVNTEKVKQDTSEIIDKSKNLIDNAAEDIDQAVKSDADGNATTAAR